MTNIYARYPRNGKTARQAANRVGASIRTAQRWTSEPREVFLKRAHTRHEQIREIRATGMTMRAIAAELGCTVSTVHYALNTAPQAQ